MPSYVKVSCWVTILRPSVNVCQAMSSLSRNNYMALTTLNGSNVLHSSLSARLVPSCTQNAHMAGLGMHSRLNEYKKICGYKRSRSLFEI